MAPEFFKKFIPIVSRIPTGQGEKLDHFKTNSGYNSSTFVIYLIKPLLFKNLYLEIE